MYLAFHSLLLRTKTPSATSRKKRTWPTLQTALYLLQPTKSVTSFLTLSMHICALRSSEQLSPPIGGFFTCVLYIWNMTQSIPDGFSMGELEALHETARHEDDCRCEKCADDERLYDGKTSDEVCDIAAKHLDAATDDCNDPIVHKVMALAIIENMIAWHTKVGMDQEKRALCCRLAPRCWQVSKQSQTSSLR